MKLNRAMLAAFALSAVSTVGFAGDDKPGKTSGSSASGSSMSSSSEWSSFTKVDADSSGFIEQTEASSVQGLDFTTADADGDQKLSRSEYEAAKRGSSGTSSGASKSKPNAAGSAIPRHSGDKQPR